MTGFPILDSPVRTVVIGYGFAGRSFHSYLIGLTPGLVLQGIVSRDAATRDRITAEKGCRTYISPEEAFADPAVQLVVIATPSSTHADLAIAAAQAGKHVVTDKVMCLNTSECDRMIDTARQNNTLLSVFQNRRLDGDFLTVQKAIAEGELGSVRWIEMAWQGFGAWGGWRGKAEMGGGRFYDLGSHLLDQLLVLFPEPVESVYCRMHHDYPNSDIESEALLVVTFQGGRTGVLDLSGMTAVSKPRFLVKGDRATLVKYGLDPQEATMKAGDIDAAVEDEANYATVKGPNISEYRLPTIAGRWRTYYENIADVLTNGTEPLVQTAEARRVMTVLDAAWQSARTGQTISFHGE